MCPTDKVTCSPVWIDEVYTDITQGECQVAEEAEEEVRKPKKVVYQYPQAPVQLNRDVRRYVKIYAPRRLQRGRNQ